ncbi:MAG: hypothetical protein IPL22_02825 [Bacteroidetes bacterium]|nr:hypothetical protein [Bacteroidota bacterium]
MRSALILNISFRNVLKYWYLYVFSMILAIVAGYYHNWYTTPIYSASCTILIKDDKRTAPGQDLLTQLNSFDNQGGIDNDVELIKSRSIIGKTLRRLDFDVTYLLRGNVKKSELYLQSPIKLIADSISFRIYEKHIEITVIDDKTYEISYHLNDDNSYTEKYKFGQIVSNHFGRFSLEKTDKFRDASFRDANYEKRNFIVILHNFDNLVDKYTKGLDIQFVSKKATVLQLSYNDPVPQKAGDFLNTLLEVYIQSGIDQKNENATSSLKFIDEQLDKITSDLKSSEEDLEMFKTEKGITDLGTEAQSFLGSVKVYDEKISEIDIQLSFLRYLEEYILKDKDLDKISPSSLALQIHC